MKLLLIAGCIMNFGAGWLPSESNSVDAVSTFNFIMAVALAYMAGDVK